MSKTNSILDRDANGRLIRKYKVTPEKYWCFHTTPSWWVSLYMTRPKRRQEKLLCTLVVAGEDPEGIAWPLGNHKPHEYYW